MRNTQQSLRFMRIIENQFKTIRSYLFNDPQPKWHTCLQYHSIYTIGSVYEWTISWWFSWFSCFSLILRIAIIFPFGQNHRGRSHSFPCRRQSCIPIKLNNGVSSSGTSTNTDLRSIEMRSLIVW